jgi:heavy metal sensor kinase
MKLVTRVSAFFLAALALALIGYSAVIYYLISNYLYRQFDADLHGALDLIAASVEVEQDDAKWQPGEHGIDLSQPMFNEVSWIVANETGQMIDRSPHVDRKNPKFQAILEYSRHQHPSAATAREIGDWRILQRELSAPNPKPITLREPHEFTSVRITVGRSLDELRPSLRRLAWLVTALPAVVWLVAAAIGRWFVGKALQPVRFMAERAASTTQADFSLRLPVDTSGDELAELGAAFNHLLDRLQSAFNRQQRFTGDAAHQLRTPLAVLLGQIGVARRRPRTTEEYQQTLALLEKQTAELSQIVESLLFLARSEEGAAPPNLESVELDVWLADYLDRWEAHPRRADLTARFNSNVTVKITPALLTQALDNLLNNAFVYSKAGTPVTLTAERGESRAVIHVQDRGLGISDVDQETIFEPFIRAAEARQLGIAGTGLGLAIVAQIARALGGEAQCTSKVGEGSTFSLELPVESPSFSGEKQSVLTNQPI